MAGLRDLLKVDKDNGSEARKIVAPIAEAYPFVAEILGGLPKTADQEAVPPSAISIWIHEGKARFSANVKGLQRTIIGDVIDIANPWQSINFALADGNVSSKRYSEKSDSYSAEQKAAIL